MRLCSRILVFVAALAASLSGTAAAQSVWNPIGPFGVGVRIWSLVVSQGDPGNVYAGYSTGIFKSANRGASWTRANSGLSGNLMAVLAIDPRLSSTLYACDQGTVLKSEDSGSTWRPAGSGLPLYPCSAVAIAPGTPSTVYIGGPYGVFRSTDGGATWIGASTGLPSIGVRAVAIDPATPSTLYAGADDVTGTGSGGVYKSTDGGATWSSTGGIGSPLVEGIVVAPSDPATVYAGTAQGLFRSMDRGEHWVFIPGVGTVVAIDPRTASVAFAAGGEFVSGVLNPLMKTTDGGATWKTAGLPASAMVVAIDPAAGDTVYCGTLDSGIFRSDDGGATWRAVNQGVSDAYVSDLGVDHGSPAFLYAGIDGVVRSPDRGGSWESANNGIGGRLNRFIFDKTSPAIYAATDGGVFKTIDRAQNWSSIGPAPFLLPGPTRFTALAIDPLDGSTLYCGAVSCYYSGCQSAIFKTTDGARNWAQVDFGFGPVLDLAIDPSRPSSLYASFQGNQEEISKSTDGGISWGLLPSVLEDSANRIVPDPGSPSVLYAAAGSLYRSADGGDSWQRASPVLPFATFVTSILPDPATPGLLYAGVAGGGNGAIYRSFDGGDSWTPLGTGLESLPVTSLALDGIDPPVLYAGTLNGGVFALSLENEAGGACFPTASTLCVNSVRFRVEVTWTTEDGTSGAGRTLPLTSDTGAFWFFSPNNIELAVKVVDGRAVNGKFWIFAGALTNVEYMLVITDTVTGAVWTHHNAPGELASYADTAAF